MTALTTMGRMNSGTVSWLKSARALKTLDDTSGWFSSTPYSQNVVMVTTVSDD